MPRPVITLLTDFGLRDHYVAAMKGVIMAICPDASLVDITHEVEPYRIADAAHQLAECWRYFPEKTIHVAVVDPGVGSERRPVLAVQNGHCFVGPDNGVLALAARNAEWRQISETGFFRHPVSSTFHGRDIFSPVAAHLAAGVPPDRFGPVIADAMRLEEPVPVEIASGIWSGEIVRVDRFGNAATNFISEKFFWIRTGNFRLEGGAASVTHFCQTFATCPQGTPALVAGSSGLLEVVVNKQNAAAALRLVAHLPIVLRRL